MRLRTSDYRKYRGNEIQSGLKKSFNSVCAILAETLATTRCGLVFAPIITSTLLIYHFLQVLD